MKGIIEIVAPIAGMVESLPLVVGAKVSAGDVLIVLQAMKTEFPIQAEQAGEIVDVLVNEGQDVEMGAALMKLGIE